MVQRKKQTKPKFTLNDGPSLKVLFNLTALFTLFYRPLQPYLHPLISSSLLRRRYMTIWSPLLLAPRLSLHPFRSCQGVYICPAHSPVPNKVERIRGEKTALLPAMVSPSISITLFLPRSDSRYISANVLRTSCAATQCFYKEKKKKLVTFLLSTL